MLYVARAAGRHTVPQPPTALQDTCISHRSWHKNSPDPLSSQEGRGPATHVYPGSLLRAAGHLGQSLGLRNVPNVSPLCHKGGAPRRYSISRPVLWWLPKPDALAYPWPTEDEELDYPTTIKVKKLKPMWQKVLCFFLSMTYFKKCNTQQNLA